jgi:multiple sugar transport system substrate-binding protein
MINQSGTKVTRRDFLKTTTVGTLAAGLGPFFLFPERAQAQQKTLKIIQWGHFVPAYDKWFDGVFTKQWGAKHNTTAIVDHVSLSEVPARAAAEVAARKGHDLYLFMSPPPAYEKHVIPLNEVYQEVERKHGRALPLAHRSTYNPKTKKYFAFSDSFVPNPSNWRKDFWEQAGYPNGPDTYDELRDGAKKIRDKLGNPCGMGLSQESDTNASLRAILWSFGGAEQDEHGNVTINSKQTVEAMKYMRALYKESETAEVFSWDPTSNNRAMLSGKISYTMNAISITRAAEKENPDMSKKIWISSALKGSVRRIAPETLMNHYVIWEFAENKEGAKQFLVDLMDNYGEAFKASEFYHQPCFPSTVPNLKEQLSNDPRANPPDKYKVLANALDWTTNIGYPGYATAAIDEAVNTFVLPTIFAKVARDEMNAEDGARALEKEIRRIFDKWK